MEKLIRRSNRINNAIFVTFLFSLFFYVLYFSYINNLDFKNSNFPYYSWLLDALLGGKLNIIPATTIDMSLFKGNWYLNWGPAPVIFILPFKIIMGMDLSDKIYTFFAGVTNIFTFYFLSKEFILFFKLKINEKSQVLLILLFAFASPNFYLSMGGRIWLTEQIVAVFYILLSLLFLFKFLNKSKIHYFFISVVLFNLAWLTRAPLFFYGIIFLLVTLDFGKKKEFLKLLSIFIFISTIGLLIFSSYNYLRFGNLFDTGLIHHLGNPRYEDVLSKRKIFSLDFLSHNFYYMFLNYPKISLKPLNIVVDLEGNSIFIFYPLTIFIVVFFKKYLPMIKNNFFFRGALITIIFELITILTYFATGWTQAGYRYFFDLIPITFLLSLFIIEKIRKKVLVFLLLIAAFLNIYAATVFFRF